MVYALSLGSTGAFLQWCSRRVASNDGTSTSIHSISQCWIVFIFVAKSAFVQLLCSQHWSFLTSLLSCNDEDCSHAQTARWVPIIAGIASISATASGWLVAPLVAWLKRHFSHVADVAAREHVSDSDSVNATDSLTGLLFVSTIILLAACCFSDLAYVLVEGSNFAQALERKTEKKQAKLKTLTESLLQESVRLLHRTPILGAMCAEVILYQSVASFLSHLFVSSTKTAISVDHLRAMYTGKV